MVNKVDIFIGDLLVQAGFASFEEVADALPIAAKTGLPVGRVLVGSKSITDSELQATLFAQSLLRDRLLSNDMALQALRKVRQEDLTLYEALEDLGWKSESYELTNRLGQLLLDSGLVTQSVLEEALEAFYTTGLPMARILVLRGVIGNHLAYTAITTQMMLRDGLLSREQAIDALKKAASRRTTTDTASDYSNYLRIQPMHTLRIGELLVLARQVSELDLLEAVERSLFTDEPIGETLVRTGKVSRQTLDQGLRAQKLITSSDLSPLEAAELLRRIEASSLSFEDAFAEVKGTPEERAEALGLFTGEQGKGSDKAIGTNAVSPARKKSEVEDDGDTSEKPAHFASEAAEFQSDEQAAEAIAAGHTPDPGLETLDDLLRAEPKPPPVEEIPIAIVEDDEESLVLLARERFGRTSPLEAAVTQKIKSLPPNLSAIGDLVKLVEMLVGKVETLTQRVGELETQLRDQKAQDDGQEDPFALPPDSEVSTETQEHIIQPQPKSLRKHRSKY